jgi:hypothetical protein
MNNDNDSEYTDDMDPNDPHDRYMMFFLMRPLNDDREGLTTEEAEDGMNTAHAVIRQTLARGLDDSEPEWIVNITVDALATAGHGARWYRTEWRRLVNDDLNRLMRD